MNPRRIAVEVVYPLPERQGIVTLHLNAGATVRDALLGYWTQSGEPPAATEQKMQGAAVARFGHLVKMDEALADGDRLDILRPLTVDPMESRRRRAQIQARRKQK